jgi:hypothetical protein
MMRVASLLRSRSSYPKSPFGAAHRLYLDTPPLGGNCLGSLEPNRFYAKVKDLQTTGNLLGPAYSRINEVIDGTQSHG